MNYLINENVKNSWKWGKDSQFFKEIFKSQQHSGSSILRPLNQPRDCDSLMIPFKYCPCQNEFKLINDTKTVLKIAEMAVQKMNEAMILDGLSNNCVELTLDRNETVKSELKVFEPIKGRQLVRIEYKTLPNGGIYDTLAEVCTLI